MNDDLFGGGAPAARARRAPTPPARAEPAQHGDTAAYSAKDIEVLEGLEPVRRRPGMYIGGTDETALHHLAAEILDNSMDEAVAGHATFIEMYAGARQPADRPRQWPRHPGRPAPQIQEQIRARGHPHHAAFRRQVLAARPMPPPAACTASAPRWSTRSPPASPPRSRARKHSTARRYVRGIPRASWSNAGPIQNRRGTAIRFVPDTEIFGDKPRSARRGSTGSAARRPICSAACASNGRCDPAC